MLHWSHLGAYSTLHLGNSCVHFTFMQCFSEYLVYSQFHFPPALVLAPTLRNAISGLRGSCSHCDSWGFNPSWHLANHSWTVSPLLLLCPRAQAEEWINSRHGRRRDVMAWPLGIKVFSVWETTFWGRGATTALPVPSSWHTSPPHYSPFQVNECLPEWNHGGKRLVSSFSGSCKIVLGSNIFLIRDLVDLKLLCGFKAKGEMELEKQGDVKKWANEVRSQNVQPQLVVSFSLVTLVTVQWYDVAWFYIVEVKEAQSTHHWQKYW